MNLPFSTKFPSGDPTYFIQKIWQGLVDDPNLFKLATHNIQVYVKQHTDKFGRLWEVPPANATSAKIHTIRADEKDRWKAGRLIHFIINNRSKERFQFAPVIAVKSLEKFVLEWQDIEGDGVMEPIGWIDGKVFALGRDAENWIELAKNDGFESTEDFFNWFDKPFKGKIIHWTNHKYVC